MGVFTQDERSYLEQAQLGRLGTVASDGTPHLVPVGWSYNRDLDTLDIGGRSPDEFVASAKFRHVQRNPRVGFVIDDVLPPFRPRCITVRGTAAAIDATAADGTRVAMIRITPRSVTSWGVPDGA